MKGKMKRLFLVLIGIVILFNYSQALAQEKARIVIVQTSRIKPFDQGVDAIRNVIAGSEFRYETITRHHLDFDRVKDRKLPKILGAIEKIRPDIIFSMGTPATKCLLEGMKGMESINKIPIVFCTVYDPVGPGFVESLESPGGRVTGTLMRTPAKYQLELLKTIQPDLKSIGVPYQKTDRSSCLFVDDITREAKKMGIKVVSAPILKIEELKEAVEKINPLSEAFLTVPGALPCGKKAQDFLIPYCKKHKKILFGLTPTNVKWGALFSISCDWYGIGLQTGNQGLTILRGKSPKDIPVQFPRKRYLVVNLKTAKDIGINIPPDIIDVADKIYKK